MSLDELLSGGSASSPVGASPVFTVPLANCETLVGYTTGSAGSPTARVAHLDDADRALLATRGAGVSHCPLSNVYFSERIFPNRREVDPPPRISFINSTA